MSPSDSNQNSHKIEAKKPNKYSKKDNLQFKEIVKKVISKIREEKSEEEQFKKTVEETIARLRKLPTTASELEITKPVTGLKDVYLKLCKALDVPPNSTFLDGMEAESMDYSYHCLGPFGVTAITKALFQCENVKSLNFSFNKLEADALPAISSLLSHSEVLTNLNLSNNGLGGKSALQLKDLIAVCYSLETLDLSDNGLGDEEFVEIARELTKSNNLKALNLSRNNAGETSCPSFGASISKCSALEWLELSGNHLEDGAKSVFGNLKHSNLKYLNISRNGMLDQTVGAIGSGLRGNKSLEELDISGNYITNNGVTALASGVKGSTTLKILRVGHNPIHGPGSSVLLNASGNLELLDMIGIKVNLAFKKILRNFQKSGKNVQVLYGSKVRCDVLPQDCLLPNDGDTIDEHNAVTFAQKLADEKGISLRNVFKKIHSDFLAEKAAQQLEEGGGKDKDKKSGKGGADKKGKKPDKTAKKTAGKTAKEPEQTEEEEKPEDKNVVRLMTAEEFAKGLTASDMSVPKGTATEIAHALSVDGKVNLWEIIPTIKWRPDDLAAKARGKKKPPPKDKGKDKKDAKGKKK